MMDKLRKIAKKLLPPIASDVLAWLRNNTGKYRFKFIGYGWQPEYNAAGTGWDVAGISALQLQKWEAYLKIISGNGPLALNHEAPLPYTTDDIGTHNMLISFAYVVSLAAHGNRSINFLDWGGGIGHYGVLAQSVLHTQRIDVRYFSYDLPHFTAAGSGLQIPDAVFSSDRALLLKDSFYDLVLSSSSLWYEPDWKTLMRHLVAASKNYIYITRIPFTENTSFVGLQNPSDVGYETLYYFHVINSKEFIDYADSLNVELIRTFLLEETIEIFNSPEKKYRYRGYLFRKRL